MICISKVIYTKWKLVKTVIVTLRKIITGIKKKELRVNILKLFYLPIVYEDRLLVNSEN